MGVSPSRYDSPYSSLFHPILSISMMLDKFRLPFLVRLDRRPRTARCLDPAALHAIVLNHIVGWGPALRTPCLLSRLSGLDTRAAQDTRLESRSYLPGLCNLLKV